MKKTAFFQLEIALTQNGIFLVQPKQEGNDINEFTEKLMEVGSKLFQLAQPVPELLVRRGERPPQKFSASNIVALDTESLCEFFRDLSASVPKKSNHSILNLAPTPKEKADAFYASLERVGAFIRGEGYSHFMEDDEERKRLQWFLTGLLKDLSDEQNEPFNGEGGKIFDPEKEPFVKEVITPLNRIKKDKSSKNDQADTTQ